MSKSFREIIAIWKTPDELAREVGAKVEAARKWKQRDSIPADYWLPVADAAKRRGKEISVETLAKLAARGR